MTQPRLPSLGEQWSASIGTLAAAYGLDEDSMAVRVYALAEQIHRHYCMSRGMVIHSEARPDQHVAVSVLMALAGTDWWMVPSGDIKTPEQGAGFLTVEEVGTGDDEAKG